MIRCVGRCGRAEQMPLTTAQAVGAFVTTVTMLSMVKDYCLGLQSPYGRYSNAVANAPDAPFRLRADLPIPARRAWFLMEAPSLVVGAAVLLWARAAGRGDAHGYAVAIMFVGHYAARTATFSLFSKGGKPMPLLIMAFGSVFTLLNGFAQTYHHLFETPLGAAASNAPLLYMERFVGLALFASGAAVNHYADHVLRTLRKSDADGGYYVPRGPFFDTFVAPNLVGEIVEWIGYALFAGTGVAWGFAACTLSNLGLRAVGHKAFYRAKFKEEFPSSRAALIPGVL